MCSGWCNNWVTRQHARCNNENSNNKKRSICLEQVLANFVYGDEYSVRIPADITDIFFFKTSWGPTSLLFSGYRSLLPGIKRPACEVDLWPPSGVKVNTEWSCNSLPTIRLPAWRTTFSFLRHIISKSACHKGAPVSLPVSFNNQRITQTGQLWRCKY